MIYSYFIVHVNNRLTDFSATVYYYDVFVLSKMNFL
jgi:hypothetical protein